MNYLPLQRKVFHVLTPTLCIEACAPQVFPAHPGAQGIDIVGGRAGNSSKGEGVASKTTAEIVNTARSQPGKPLGLVACGKKTGGLLDPCNIPDQAG